MLCKYLGIHAVLAYSISRCRSLIYPACHSLRYQTNATNFYYFNNASFPNISPRFWEGAYHTSELPLLFGTFQLYGNASATPYEYSVSEYWQDMYLAFAKDPVNGLPALG